jgi:hypothetical protein
MWDDGMPVEAAFVARDAEGVEWFECEKKHEPEEPKAIRTPIAEWFAAAGLPVPVKK